MWLKKKKEGKKEEGWIENKRKKRERKSFTVDINIWVFFFAWKVTSIELFVFLRVSYNKTINEVDFAIYLFIFEF